MGDEGIRDPGQARPVERQPVEKWKDRALAERDPQAALEALVALSRIGRSAKATEASLAAAQGMGTYILTQFSFAPARVVEFCATMARAVPEVPILT